MRLLYSLSIILYTGLVRLASPFSTKAKLWVHGRKKWRQFFRELFSSREKRIWVHCASLGEFEQGRPVIEAIRDKIGDCKILLTFFSPSGYEIRKSWPVADYICYLPADTPRNASDFIDLVNPRLVFFVKYEFWNNYITVLHKRKVPLYLISAIFRPEQYFFRWYGKFFRKILEKFTHIFVQDNNSLELLKSIGLTSTTMAGDTRFDRVRQIASAARDIPLIGQFAGNEKVIVAGSSWMPDEEIITAYINKFPGRFRWIFAPHEIDRANIERLRRLVKVNTVCYSEPGSDISGPNVLILDNMGMLSSVYRYASIAVIGGGFGKGIHNILEAACWGIPVLFGPNHGKFREAKELIEAGGAFCFRNKQEFTDILGKLFADEDLYETACRIAGDYVSKNAGATEKIVIKALPSEY